MRNQLLVLCLVVSGCSFDIKTCTTDDDCVAGGYCGEGGFCVANTDGGSTGGGTTTTGGGSGGGGGTGGGAQGGGTQGGGSVTGGGMASPCESSACPEACAIVDGGAECVPYFVGINLNAPDAGSMQASGFVSFQAELMLGGSVSGAPPYPSSLSGTIDGAPVALPAIANAGTYAVSTSVTCTNSTRVVNWSVALEDGGLAAQSSYTCDGKPPVLTWVGISNGNQFKRDEVFVAELNSDEPVTNVQVTLAGSQIAASPLGLDGGACVALGGCWKFDFSKPALSAIAQQWDVSAQADDAVGNSGSTQLQVGVSRERWMVRLTTSALNAAPAVGAEGYIYTGSSNGSDTGTVYRVDPLTGGTDAGLVVGAVQGVALAKSGAEEFLFVAANNGINGQLFGRATSDLMATAGLQVPCGSNNSTFIRVAPALVFVSDGDGGGEVAAVAASNNSGGTAGLFLRWTPSANSCLGPAVASNLAAEVLTPPLNVVVANAVTAPSARFIRNVSGAWALREVTDIANSPALSTSTVDFDGGGARAQVLVNGNSLVSEVQTSEWNGVSDFRNLRSLVSTIPGVAGVSWTYAGPWGTVVAPAVPSLGAPSMLNSTTAYVGLGTQMIQFSPSAPGALAVANAVPGLTASADIKTAPVLLATVDGVSWGYVVDANGQIGAFATQGTGAPWFSQDAVTHPVTAHPGFGCNTRQGSAQNTGILYIASSDGWLRAIIVDGKSLSEATGAWPKYQRSMSNAGNDDTSNFRTNGVCP